MEVVLGTLAFIMVLVWAFRLEINTAKSAETLQRIEKLIQENKKGKK